MFVKVIIKNESGTYFSRHCVVIRVVIHEGLHFEFQSAMKTHHCGRTN